MSSWRHRMLQVSPDVLCWSDKYHLSAGRPNFASGKPFQIHKSCEWFVFSLCEQLQRIQLPGQCEWKALLCRCFPLWLSKTSEMVSQSVFSLELFTWGFVTVMQSHSPQNHCSLLVVSFQPEKSFSQLCTWLCLDAFTVSRNSTGSKDVAKQSHLQWLITALSF